MNVKNNDVALKITLRMRSWILPGRFLTTAKQLRKKYIGRSVFSQLKVSILSLFIKYKCNHLHDRFWNMPLLVLARTEVSNWEIQHKIPLKHTRKTAIISELHTYSVKAHERDHC